MIWLREKAGRELTDAMLRGEGDSLDLLGAQRVETVSLINQKIWAARQDFQDETVPRRTWITEAMLGAVDTRSLFLGFRLHCVTLGEQTRFSRSIPRFMRQIAENYNVYLDGVNAELTAQDVATEDESSELLRLIRDPQRKSPVIAISTLIGNDGDKTLVEPDRLAGALFSVGHVRTLSRSASFAVTDAIGKRFSVFNGAIRVWWPNFSERDDPYDHPLMLAERVSADGPQSTIRDITDRVLRNSAGRRDADHAIPSFSEVRRAAATIFREQIAARGPQAADEMLPLYEAENLRLVDELKDQKAEHLELMAMADEDMRNATADRDNAKNETYILRARISEMEKAIRFKEHKPDIEIPDDFENIEAWVSINIGEMVQILPRAFNAAKKSVFENPALAYQAIILLQEAYVPMRRSGSSYLKEKWETGLAQLGLECSPTHSGARAGENASDYFVTYRGRKMEIDMHLKGSNSRDPRYGFRLYFFWDNVSAVAVVASFPSHLGTRIS